MRFKTIVLSLALLLPWLPARPSNGEAPAAGRILCGIDLLMRDGFLPLRGKRVGLVTNQTGVAHDRTPTVDVLARAPGVKLLALFGPEHGVRGTAQAGARVSSGRDARTGLPVYSLYGATREPTAAMLRGIDLLVFDIQDIGSRSYTYIATMGRCMDACARHNIPFMVLDRPNLIGGERVEGNILDPRFRSFVGPYPIAYCYGMTVGELARMVNGRRWLSGGRSCDLTVIPVEGWRRGEPALERGLPWVQTSPNVPYPQSPYYYAATGIVGELPALSIGVGTEWPFEVAGAPGLNGDALAAELNRRRLAGVSFAPAQWKPSHGVFAGRTCSGVRISITDYDRAELTRMNFETMDALRKVAPSRPLFGQDREADRLFDLDCGTDRVRHMFLEGRTAAQIWAYWNSGAARFREQRRPYLMYR